MMIRWSMVAAVLPLICAGSLGAQGPAGEVPGDDPGMVTVRVSAVVTDRKGHAILNLRPADFELRDDGASQKIAAVVVPPVPPPTRSVPPITSEADEIRAARDSSTRVFAILLDEFHVPAGDSTMAVREAFARFIDEQVRPGDLVAVLRPLDSLTSIHFTRDRGAVKSSVAAFSGRLGDFAPRTAFEEEYIGRAPATVQAARAQLVTNALRELTMKLGELEAARPAVLVASRGFAAPVNALERRSANPQAIARAASYFNIPFYTFDPDETSTGDGVGSPFLSQLAADTGGQAFVGRQALASGPAQVSRDLDSLYLITYQPARPPDGRFHALEVVAKRRDARVRTRRGYWSPLGSEWRAWLDRATRPAPAVPIRGLRRSPLIETWAGLVRDSDGGMRLVFTWEPRPRRLGGNARAPQPQRVSLTAKTTGGDLIFEGELLPVPSGAGSTADRARFAVPPGRIQLDLKIFSGDGSLIDTGAQDFDVAVGKGPQPVILAPQIIRAWTARDFRTLSEDATAAPSPAREFSRTERLLIRTPAYDPGGAPVEITARLVNSRGELMRQLARLASPDESPTPQFDLPLAWLAPGNYAIEVTASNGGNAARELLRFRIIG